LPKALVPRKDEWKEFEEVDDDPRVETGEEYLSLKKSTQFDEGKSLEVTFYSSSDDSSDDYYDNSDDTDYDVDYSDGGEIGDYDA
jgi:hypothetical protein